jgi:hypothetical protein
MPQKLALLVVYDPVPSESPVRLERFRILSGGVVLVEQSLTDELFGDPRYGEMVAIGERLPEPFVHSRVERR